MRKSKYLVVSTGGRAGKKYYGSYYRTKFGAKKTFSSIKKNDSKARVRLYITSKAPKRFTF